MLAMMLCSVIDEESINNVENIRDLYVLMKVNHIQVMDLLNSINNKLDRFLACLVEE